MLILSSPSEVKPLKLPNIICALGVFDGVHLGHQKIIEAVVRSAKETRGTSLIITFDKHPYTVLNPSCQISLLTSSSHKLQLFDRLGIDVSILIKFNKNTASITAENWIKNILWEQLHIKGICIGEDSFFGKNREGNVDLLREWGNHLGFSVNVIETARINRVPVNSTLIRNNIRRGDLESAKRFLGRDYSVQGTVVKGNGRGKELGFPTANLSIENQCLPLNGVYAVWARLNNKAKPAVSNIGTRPTFVHLETAPARPLHPPDVHRQDRPILEVYFLEEEGPLYNKNLEVIFIKRLRNEIRFSTTSQLIQQIEKDIAHAKQVLI